jgi:uncharacterized RDD family membrane protein YckC
MAEPPRDPLAEHPLAPEPESARRTPARTLDLFGDVGETPLRDGSPSRAEAPRPELPRAEPPRAEPVDAPRGRSAVRAAEEILAPPRPDELEAEDPDDGPRAVAFARRVAAGLADLLILALVGAVELAAGALVLDLRFPPPAFLPLAAFLFLAALVLLVLAPLVWGTTPGMALADLRIRAADGGSPTLAAAFRRFLGFLLTGALAGVPLLVAAFDRRGRTLADLLSGTTIEGIEAPEPPGRA